MKKTYINPNTLIVKTSHQRPIALSDPPLSLNAGRETSTLDVKGNYYNSPRYNVWDDDWSK